MEYLWSEVVGKTYFAWEGGSQLPWAVQIVKKVDLEAQRGPRQNQRRKRNPIEDLRREVSIMRTLRHKNIVSLQVCLVPHHLCVQTLYLIPSQTVSTQPRKLEGFQMLEASQRFEFRLALAARLQPCIESGSSQDSRSPLCGRWQG